MDRERKDATDEAAAEMANQMERKQKDTTDEEVAEMVNQMEGERKDATDEVVAKMENQRAEMANQRVHRVAVEVAVESLDGGRVDA